ncbi:MAG: hypothetical protein QM751_07295 [Paludibacteraceae bacterium]
MTSQRWEQVGILASRKRRPFGTTGRRTQSSDGDGQESTSIYTAPNPSGRQVKAEQQGHVGIPGGIELGCGVLDGIHIAEVFHMAAKAEAGLVIGGAIAGFGLGVYELHEAHENGKAQSEALTREQAHVGLVGALDLSGRLQDEALRTGLRRGVARNRERRLQDRRAAHGRQDRLAQLQLHCNRG